MKLFYLYILTILLVACKTKKTNSNNTNSSAIAGPKFKPSKDKAFKTHFFNALKEKSLENYDKAIELFQKCIDIKPNHASSYHEMSRIYSNEGNFILALQNAEKAYELDDKNKWYLVQLAEMQKKALQYDNVLGSYEKLVKLDPKNLDFLINLSEAYMVNKKPEKAADIINKIENIVGKNDELILQKKALYLQAGKEDKAIQEIKKLVDKDPKSPKYLNMLGQLYDDIGKHDKAIEQYKKIIALNPNDGLASLALARYYKNNGDDQKVHENMKVTFSDEKISPSLKLSILMDYITESVESEEIKKQCHELISIMQSVHPKSVKSYVVAGDFYTQHENLEKARGAYLKASDLDKNSYPIWVQLLTIDMETNNHQNLYDDSYAALELFPSQPAFYLYNGIAAFELKKYEQALKILKSGKDLIIDDDKLMVDFYRYIGEAYHAQKNYREADNAFEKALEINPNQPYLLNNYSYYLSVRKENLTRAEELAEKANEIIKNQASFEDTYGWVLFQQKKYDKAEIWLKKALDDGGDESGTILEHYGDVLFFLNRKSEALEYWKKASKKEGFSEKLTEKINKEKYVE